jgi:hypothetical protein
LYHDLTIGVLYILDGGITEDSENNREDKDHLDECWIAVHAPSQFLYLLAFVPDDFYREYPLLDQPPE